MNRTLYLKLTLAFMLVAFTTAALVAVFIRATSVDRLSRLVVDQQRDRLEEVLARYYGVVGSWDGVQENWREIQFITNQMPGTAINSTPRKDRAWWPTEGLRTSPERAIFGLVDTNGKVLVAVDSSHPVGSVLSARLIRQGEPVVVDNQAVGTILTAQSQPVLSPSEALFLRRTTQALIYAMLIALLVALALGILLARTLTRPLRALTNAARGIAEGDLEQQVSVSSTDEIGQLAVAFNRMSLEVSKANQLRQQMTADIAHDLRTPLTVIGGYIESMRDGVLQPTPKRMAIIYAEIERLQHLVNDLRVLSQAEAGELALNPQAILSGQLLKQAAVTFQHQAGQRGVTIRVEVPPQGAVVYVDEARMLQVLDNLISNALRYTPEGGTITLATVEKPGSVEIHVQDNGSGISADVLPYIFHRFKRGEASRHAELGESGLGLSIVKAFVEAQNGCVWAKSIEGSGTTIFIEFPIYLGTGL